MLKSSHVVLVLTILLCVLSIDISWAGSQLSLPGVQINIADSSGSRQDVAAAIKVVVLLTVLSLAPSLLIAMTSFTRIIIVLSLLRHALGLQETPPNSVMVSLALFLTLFVMMPTLAKVNEDALQPYLTGTIDTQQAVDLGLKPLRQFMLKQTREQDLELMLKISKTPPPKSPNDVATIHIIPAFMLSELKTAFQIGFVIFLPFLLIDLVVSSVLMAMGMMMVPPVMISLPVKILMFILIDGWNLVTKAIISSFY